MKCQKCNFDIQNGDLFCSKCGNPVITQTSNEANDFPNKNKQSAVQEIKLFNKVYRIEYILFIILSSLALVSTILPFLSASYLGTQISRNVLSCNFTFGYAVPIVAIVCILFGYLKNEFMMMWSGLINLFFSIAVILEAVQRIHEAIIGNLAIGAYLHIICSILLFGIGCHLAIKNKHEKKERSPLMSGLVFRFKIGLIAVVLLFVLLLLAKFFG